MNVLRLGVSRTTALQARHFSTTRPANAKVAVIGAAGTLSPFPALPRNCLAMSKEGSVVVLVNGR